MSSYTCVAPVQGCALRITRENICGVPLDPLTENSRIQTQKFVMASSSPQNLDPNEILLQNACSSVDTFWRTPRRTKYHEFTLQMSWVDLPMLEMLLDASLLAAPDDPTEFIGWGFANGLTQPNPNPKMIEIQSYNANQAECGTGSTPGPIVRHLWPLVRNLALSDTLTINNTDPFTITLVGDAMNNPNWAPSFPGPTFPSYVPGGGDPDGTMTGPAPTVLPADIPADPWSLDDQAEIQAGGPYWERADTEFFDATSWECSYVNGGS